MNKLNETEKVRTKIIELEKDKDHDCIIMMGYE